MGFDALTLAAVRDELEPLLTGARVQKLVFIDELSLCAEFFAPSIGRTYVLLSAHLEQGRIQRLDQLAARGLEVETPFSLLVRKHLRNARVRAIRQIPLERVFELDCEQRDSSGRLVRVLLIVEAMGRRSNLVLVDEDGMILDAARRTPPSRNPRRPVLPHLPYVAPPGQDKLMPQDVSAESLATDELAALDKHLAQRIAGLSPLAAREIAFRVGPDADWSRVASVTREFLDVLSTHSWEPTVALDADGPIEYASYALGHLQAAGAELKNFATISRAMAEFYLRAAARPQRGDPLAAERKALLVPIERARHSTERRIAALEHQLATASADCDRLRRAGEAILTHYADIAEGQTELLEGGIDGDRIELEPRLSAVENAQAYFARYRRAHDAEQRVPQLLEEARQSADYLAELRALVEVADQMDAIRALRREVAGATGARSGGARSADTRKTTRSTPYRRIALGAGSEALIGSSAAGNAMVTFELARAEDLWLHARGVPGAHVILRTEGTPQPDVVERAAQLAAGHSAARQASAVEVDVTARRYVKKIPGAAPGLVRYSNERTLRVTPGAA